MKLWESTGLEYYFGVDGQEKAKKQTINNVIEAPTEENIKAFGLLLDQITPDTNKYISTVIVSKSRIHA